MKNDINTNIKTEVGTNNKFLTDNNIEVSGASIKGNTLNTKASFFGDKNIVETQQNIQQQIINYNTYLGTHPDEVRKICNDLFNEKIKDLIDDKSDIIVNDNAIKNDFRHSVSVLLNASNQDYEQKVKLLQNLLINRLENLEDNKLHYLTNEAIQILSNLSKNALDVLLFLYFIRINPRHHLNMTKLSQKQSREFIGSIVPNIDDWGLLEDDIDELKRKGLIFEDEIDYRVAQPDWIVNEQVLIKNNNTKNIDGEIYLHLGSIGQILFEERPNIDISKLGCFIIDNNLSNLKIPNYITDMLIKNKA